MQDRRQAERFRLDLPARWQSLLTQGRGSICDLSASGCFLLTAGNVRELDLIRLEMDFGEHLVFVWGVVVYHIEEMGFGMRFVFNEENEERAFQNLLEELRRQSFDTVAPVS